MKAKRSPPQFLLILRKGVVFARVLLHTGISSLEEDEVPYPEYMELRGNSASIIHNAKDEGRRIIVWAVESAVGEDGKVVPYQRNTDCLLCVITG